MTAASARILLLDDHPAVRQGLAILLDSRGHAVGGEADTREDALALLAEGDFDLAIVDLSLESGSGLDLLADLTARAVPALIYSMHEDPQTIAQALSQGARGYVTKRDEPRDLLLGVAAVLRGERFVAPRAARALDEPSGAGGEASLSARERQVLEMTGRGQGNAEIAFALGIGPRTVETYHARIAEKLGLSGVRDLRKYAIARRTETPSPS